MTPDVFREAQKLFLEVIQLPVERRESYLQQHAPGDDVRDEVRSLLRFHNDETLIVPSGPTLDQIPPAIDDTVALSASQLPPHFATEQAPLPDPPATPQTIGPTEEHSAADLSDRFAKSTNQLLRSRLISATILLSGMLVVVTIISALTQQLDSLRLASRTVTLVALAACRIYLRKHVDLHHSLLRAMELVIIAAPLTELGLIQWVESSDFLRDNDAVQIEELRAIASTAAAIYIAVYGIFIPSTWQRTAVVTGIVAVFPTFVSVMHQISHDYPPHVADFNFINPTLTCCMAVVATSGASIVHRFRREALSAKYFGQYELIREIGRGGMGVVYLGKHHFLKRPAAIKLIRTESAGSPDAIARFEKEVQATATLSHWNTVQIYDYGTTEGGDFYCVMEYLDGVTLLQRLCDRGTLPVGEAFEIVVQLCDGLEEAHRRGLIHRDIKPANIFLAKVGGVPDVVKILDFGLVTSSSESEPSERIGGTPAYMSPEQIRGDALDGRSDIYAIGCVLYQCLTGQPPFRSMPISQLLSDQLFKVPKLQPIDRFGDGVSSVVRTCLAKDPGERFPDVAALRTACRECVPDPVSEEPVIRRH